MTAAWRRRKPRRDDRGATLILAMVLLFAIGLSLLAVVNFAGAAATTTINLHDLATTESEASSATTLAIQWSRYNNITPSSTPSETACLPSGVAEPVVVACTGTSFSASRKIQFFTCVSGTSASACAAATSPSVLLLYSEVTYNDLPPGIVGALCSAINTCGISLTIDNWDVRAADS